MHRWHPILVVVVVYSFGFPAFCAGPLYPRPWAFLPPGSLVSTPGPSWAGPLWASRGSCGRPWVLVGPCGPPGNLVGPLWALVGLAGPLWAGP